MVKGGPVKPPTDSTLRVSTDDSNVRRLVKSTTPKGLREVKNVLRWRVPNESPTATEVKNLNYTANVDRPRSAPSASISDPPEKMQRAASFTKPGGRSPSTAQPKSKTNSVHKRHWMYLYDNLHRAVDEMYKTCEQDFSTEQCVNVIHTLELCMEDFTRLAHKIGILSGLSDDFANSKPRSIAWDESYPRTSPTILPTPTSPIFSFLSQSPIAAPISPMANPNPDIEIISLDDIQLKTRHKSPDLNLNSDTLPESPTKPKSPRWSDSESDEDTTVSGNRENETEKEGAKDEAYIDMDGNGTMGKSNGKETGKDGATLGSAVGSGADSANGGANMLWAERLKRSLSRNVSTSHIVYKPKGESPFRGRARQRQVGALRKTNPTTPKHKNQRSPDEARMLQDEKQAKASKNREHYVNSKKEKVALVLSRVRDVTERQSQKIATKQATIEEKQEKAGIIHEAHIDQIKRKATAENTKVDEVAYITTQLTETLKFIQQKRSEDTEARRQGQLEGKKKKLVVQAAKEEAVVERKKQMEHARLHMQIHNDALTTPPNHGNRKSPTKSPKLTRSKVDLDLEARRLKRVCKYCNVELLSDEYLATHLSDVKHRQALKQKNIHGAPREDADGNTADDAARRDDESVAKEGTECVLTIPLAPNLTLQSPSVNLMGIIEAERAQKKKAKKTKAQIAQLALSYIDTGVQPPRESPHKSRLVRSVTDLKSLLNKKSFSTMPGVLSDISRVLGSKGGHMEIDLQIFRQLGGIDVLVSICGSPESKIPYNVFSESISLLSLACTQPSNRLYILMTGRLVPLIDLLNRKNLLTPEAPFLSALATLLTLHFWQSAENADEIKQQIITYMIQICLFEKIEQKLAQLQANVDNDPSASLFIEKTVEFLESITAFLQSNTRDKPIYEESSIGSPIIQIFKKTNIVGIIPLLASLLLKGKPSRGSSTPPALTPTIWSIIFSSVKVMDNLAALDFKFLQSYLGDDDYQVEMFHLLGHLFWYCSASEDDLSFQKRQKLLNEIILLAGYYSLQNSRTQETFQWGNSPTILQLLCGLPFQYFSDARYKTILFPTLVSVCFKNPRNVGILQTEMSADLIVEYIKSEIENKDNSPHPSQVPARFLFKNRFPPTLWQEALDFFSPKTPDTPK